MYCKLYHTVHSSGYVRVDFNLIYCPCLSVYLWMRRSLFIYFISRGEGLPTLYLQQERRVFFQVIKMHLEQKAVITEILD